MFVCCQNIRVSLNYSQIRVQDKSAYPSVSTQSHLLMCKSLRLGIRSEVYATTVHHRAVFYRPPFWKRMQPENIQMRMFGIAMSCRSAVQHSCGNSCVLQAPSFVLKRPCPLLRSQEQGKKLFLSRSNA